MRVDFRTRHVLNQKERLVDRGAKVDIQSRLGWTPLTISKGIFMEQSKKEFPAAAKILQKAMADKGLVVASRE